MEKPNLLIVDDEKNIRLGLKLGIDWAALGIGEVYAACDGIEAITLLQEHPIHIIITDVRMPGIDGLELCARVSTLYPNTQMIILSGYSEFSYAQKAVRYGASEYLLKPVKIQELSECVKRCAEKIKQQNSIRSAAYMEEQSQRVRSLLAEQGEYAARIKSYTGLAKHERFFGQTELSIQKNSYSNIVLQALDFINQNYTRDLSVDLVAEHVGKSNNYFSSLFKKETGLSFTRYLKTLRIAHAKLLLAQTMMLTSEISEQVGFGDYKYFSTVFHDIVGVSPSEYRRDTQSL